MLWIETRDDRLLNVAQVWQFVYESGHIKQNGYEILRYRLIAEMTGRQAALARVVVFEDGRFDLVQTVRHLLYAELGQRSDGTICIDDLVVEARKMIQTKETADA